jgi:ABC-type polysaccharide/polyol phosphate transport system ATPase subunit
VIDVRCCGVSKRYLIRGGGGSWAELAGRLGIGRAPGADFWAVQDVSFSVEQGEVVGVIGTNGAGKSTLFKLLSGITAPTAGEMRIRGRLSALLEVGSGFHPELTGRENVYLSGSLLGMTRRRIRERFDRIVDFAGVARFIDVPIKRYSSGMSVRLGFSVAAHLEPDILLLDEVLAVGDAAFQVRCYERVAALRKAGTTIIIISHDLAAIDRLCHRVLLMERGRIVADGPPREVIARYASGARLATAGETALDAPVSLGRVTLHDARGGERNVFHAGDALGVRVEVSAREAVEDVVLEVALLSAQGEFLCQLAAGAEDGPGLRMSPGRAVLDFACPSIALPPGVYVLDAAVRRRVGPDGGVLHRKTQCAMLRVDHGRPVTGQLYMAHEWRWSETTNGHEPQRTVSLWT